MTLHARIEGTGDCWERRLAGRERLMHPIQATAADQPDSEFVVHDLSPSGLLIETDADLPDGARLAIELPGMGVVEATVVWGTGRYFGGQFTTPMPLARFNAALASGVIGGSRPLVCAADEQQTQLPTAAKGSTRAFRLPMLGAMALAAWLLVATPIFFF